MEILPVIGREAVRIDVCIVADFRPVSIDAAPVDIFDILEEPLGAPHGRGKIAQTHILFQRVWIKPCFDIGTVLTKHIEIGFSQGFKIRLVIGLEGRLAGAIKTRRTSARDCILTAIPG